MSLHQLDRHEYENPVFLARYTCVRACVCACVRACARASMWTLDIYILIFPCVVQSNCHDSCFWFASSYINITRHVTRRPIDLLIPKPHFQAVKVNSRCRRFVAFRRFGSICRRYDRCCRWCCRWRSIACSLVRNSVFTIVCGCFFRV